MLNQIIVVIAAVLAVWCIYSVVRKRPESFSRAALGKSFSTLGILALGLIAFVWLLVLMLKSA